jgi:methylase of polypeptide subunit release factors
MATLAREYDVGWQVIKRVLRNAQLEGAVDEGAVQQHMGVIRRGGFPQPGAEVDPIVRVRDATVTITGDVIRHIGHVGQNTCLAAHPQRFEARRGDQLSVVEAFHDDAALARAIRYQLGRGDPATPQAVVRALQALVRAPRNFPPALARWLVDEYAPANSVVLDPCAGFGGRLLGTAASAKNLRYVGFDIEPRTVDGNNTLAKRLGVGDRAAVTLRDAVSPEPWPQADLVLTSPPYFNLEDYGDASRVKHATYAAWRDDFLYKLVAHALIAAPVVILNVANVGKNDLPADVVAVATALGGTCARVIRWPLPKFGTARREEKILVLRR